MYRVSIEMFDSPKRDRRSPFVAQASLARPLLTLPLCSLVADTRHGLVDSYIHTRHAIAYYLDIQKTSGLLAVSP